MKKKHSVQAEVDAVLGGLRSRERAEHGGVASGLAVREIENKEMVGSFAPSWPPLGTTTRCTDKWGEYNDDSDKSEDPPILA